MKNVRETADGVKRIQRQLETFGENVERPRKEMGVETKLPR